MKQTTQLTYQDRLQQVLDYIDTHLDDENLDQDRLSTLACFSKCHFHRIFSAFVGMPLYQYIQYMRLKRAAFQLAYEKQTSIIDVALNAGYDSHEAFSRRFKKVSGITPSDFRQKPDWQPWQDIQLHLIQQEGGKQMKPTMKTINNIRLAMVEHRGSPSQMGEGVAKIMTWAKQYHGPVKAGEAFGIAYNDPETTPETEFKFDLGIQIPDSMQLNDGNVIEGHIAGGRYAVITHCGSHSQLGGVIQATLKKWLPESGEELRDIPLLFNYQNDDVVNVAEDDLVTDIYFPLK